MTLIEIRQSAKLDADKLSTPQVQTYTASQIKKRTDLEKRIEELTAVIEGYKDSLYSR
jgi:hypothetical protein